MKALPPAHGSWSALVALFAPDLGPLVSAMAGRLEALLGKPRERAHAGSAEPDGFSGFARRGSYERLLLSEWLLADEAPDEFLRRAASGEHAFHELARRDPASRRTVLVLLDAGPTQVGAPRLAHIAALVALDRRARTLGATLAWAQLGSPETPPATEVDALRFAGFVAARTDRAPAKDAAAKALATAHALGPFAEVWLVGAESLRQQRDAGEASHLFVEELFDPSRRALVITAENRGLPRRSTTIDLPEPRACVRMLRDPFEVRPSARKTLPPPPSPSGAVLDLSKRFHLAPRGTRLLGLTTEGHAVGLGVNGLGSSNAGKDLRIAPSSGESIVAIGLREKKLYTVGLRGTTLIVRGAMDGRPSEGQLGLHDLADWIDGGPALATPIDPEGLGHLLVAGRERVELMFRGATWHAIHSRNLAVVSHLLPYAEARVPRTGGRRKVPPGYYFLSETAEGLEVGPPFPLDPASTLPFISIGDVVEPVEAFGVLSRSGGSHVAVKVDERDWLVIHRPPRGADPPRSEWARVTISSGRVVGFAPTSWGPGFVVVRDRDRVVELRHVNPRAPSPRPRAFTQRIRSVVCATERPVAAVALEDGTVQVVELELDRLLLVARGQVR